MGANNSSGRVSFESDEKENVTVVKGIRLSDNVIKRMREPPAPPKGSPSAPPAAGSPASSPLPQPAPPLFSSPPPPSLKEPVVPPTPTAPSPTETVTASAPPKQPQVDPAASAPVPPHASVLESAPVSTPAAPAVDEEAQKKKISDYLYQSWEQKRASAEQEQRAWIEEKKARLSAQAEVQTQLQDDAFRMSSSEKAVTTEDLQHTLMEESIAVENEKRRVEIYAKQLQAREANVQKQDAFYRQHVARLEERSAQFYKATTESYHKAADEVNAKFKRYEVHPVCADLQGQIFKCYRENASRTLLCSDIAALYQQCVNNAKQDKLTPGG